MYNSNTDSLGLILGVEVFFLWVTVQEHCEQQHFFFAAVTFSDSLDAAAIHSCVNHYSKETVPIREDTCLTHLKTIQS